MSASDQVSVSTTPPPAASLRPLHLSCNVQGYAIFQARKQNSAFQKMAKAVWERDDYRCVYCGFQCQSHQEAVNAEKPYTDNRITVADLVTACPLCADCFFIGAYAEPAETGGRLIQLPELSQATVNTWARVLLCLMEEESLAYQGYAKSLYRSLRQRLVPFEAIFGTDASIPTVFTTTLVDAGVQAHPNYQILMQSIRWLPGRSQYRHCLASWAPLILPLLGEIEQRRMR